MQDGAAAARCCNLTCCQDTSRLGHVDICMPPLRLSIARPIMLYVRPGVYRLHVCNIVFGMPAGSYDGLRGGQELHAGELLRLMTLWLFLGLPRRLLQLFTTIDLTWCYHWLHRWLTISMNNASTNLKPMPSILV